MVHVLEWIIFTLPICWTLRPIARARAAIAATAGQMSSSPSRRPLTPARQTTSICAFIIEVIKGGCRSCDLSGNTGQELGETSDYCRI
jgi:hypothetical protein